jgi:hypothetical protein
MVRTTRKEATTLAHGCAHAFTLTFCFSLCNPGLLPCSSSLKSRQMDRIEVVRVRRGSREVGYTELLKRDKSVTGLLKECSKSVTRVLQECSKSATKVLQECYKSVAGLLQECYKSVARVLQECYRNRSATPSRGLHSTRPVSRAGTGTRWSKRWQLRVSVCRWSSFHVCAC